MSHPTIESAVTTWSLYGLLLGGLIGYGVYCHIRDRREKRRDAQPAPHPRMWTRPELKEMEVRDVLVFPSGRVVEVRCADDPKAPARMPFYYECEQIWRLPASTDCPIMERLS